MGLAADDHGLPNSLERTHCDSAASELNEEPQHQKSDNTNSGLESHSATPSTHLLSPTTNSAKIPPLSSTTAELLARVNGSGRPESANASSPPRTDNTADSQPQTFLQANVVLNCSNYTQPETNITASSISAAGTVDNNPGDPLQTPSPPIPSTPTLSEQQNNMKSHPKKPSAKPSNGKQPEVPTKSTAPPASAGPDSKAVAPKQKAAGGHRGGGDKRIKKRKARKDGDEDGHDGDGVVKAGESSSDESNEPTPTTTQTKSGRQIHRPPVFAPSQQTSASPTNQENKPPRKRRRLYRKGRENNITCLHCNRASSPATNLIVFCDDCNGAWHQFCHDPPINDDVVTVKEAQWLCKECRPMEDSSSQSLQDEPAAVDSENPLLQIPSPTLVGGSQFSQDQRRGYVSGLSHSTLVNLLLEVSTSQPELPLFPENLPDLRSSVFPPPQLQSTNKVSRDTIAISNDTATAAPAPTAASVAATSATLQSITERMTTESSTSLPATTTTPLNYNDSNTTIDEEVDGYIEHRLYPKAGNGFRLPPDSVDLNMLLEDPACSTFSHSLHGPAKAMAKAMAEAGAVPAVGGIA